MGSVVFSIAYQWAPKEGLHGIQSLSVGIQERPVGIFRDGDQDFRRSERRSRQWRFANHLYSHFQERYLHSAEGLALKSSPLLLVSLGADGWTPDVILQTVTAHSRYLARSALGQDGVKPSRRFSRAPCHSSTDYTYELCIHIYFWNGLTLKVPFLRCGRRPVKCMV